MERGNLARARMVSPGRDQSSEHIKISPKRGWFRLGEISPESTSNLRPSECFRPSEKSLIQSPKERVKRNFRVLERGSGLGGTGERKRTRTTEDSCSSFGNLSSLNCNGYYK